MSERLKVAVIGAGPMGLACAHRLLAQGHRVTVYEAGDRLGGMSTSFDFNGLTIERYYHFICRPDRPLLSMLDDLGIADRLHWVDTRMGLFYDGQLYEWGRPDGLIRFPHIGFVSKLRYAAHVYYAKSIRDFKKLDKLDATDWVRRWVGRRAFDVLWRRLFELKFFEHSGKVSAAWIAARISRVANSRRSMMQESLGYLEGGSETFLRAIAQRVLDQGGAIETNAPVESVLVEDGRVTGLRVGGKDVDCEIALSTMPLQYVPRLVKDLSAAEKSRIEAIENFGVACVIMKLRRALTPYFWLNINDDEIALPGLVEYSNLQDVGSHILYAPYYLPNKHPKYRRPDETFFAEVRRYLKRINPEFTDDWVLSECVSRYDFAQPVCGPGFYAKLPDMRTSVEGFFMADTSYYYPEDRSISESIRVGRQLAEQLESAN